MKVSSKLAALLLAVAGTAAQAQYPSKVITIISPFAPGGSSDFVGRVVAQKMMDNNPSWRIVIETKPGANGQIGSDQVAKAAPDGYTLVLGPSSTHGIQPSLFKKLPYDVLKDFAAITMLGATANIIAVNPALPVNNVKDLIAYGKANPGKLNFSSPGSGTSVHISGEMFKDSAGIDMSETVDAVRSLGDLHPRKLATSLFADDEKTTRSSPVTPGTPAAQPLRPAFDPDAT